METVLVTGGAGFIGSHLCTFLAKDHRVICVDNRSGNYSSPDNTAHIASQQFIDERVDIVDAQALDAVFAKHKPDKVVHLAARAGVRRSIEQPAEYARVNVLGTANVLESARRHQVKQFVFGSSSSVYGNSATAPFAENDITDAPISPYAATKKAGELLCRAHHELYAIPTTCLRFFTVYGERGRPDMAVYKFIQAISSGEPITVFGNGTRRDYTYIADIVNGIANALAKPFPFEIFNLGNSSPVELPFLVQTIEETIGKDAKLQMQSMQKGDVTQTYANVAHAHTLLNWKPRTSIHEGIRRTVRWFDETH